MPRPRWQEGEHEVRRWCRLVRTIGARCDPEDLRLGVTASHHDYIVLHPGAASPARRWPVARWARVARHFSAAGWQVAVTGSDAERELCQAVIEAATGGRPSTLRSYAGALSLAQLTGLVAGARLVLSGDTGIAHLATALGRASVVLFGPVSPATWGPIIDPQRHRVLWHGDGTGDPHGTQLDPALAAISVAEVWQAAAQLLHTAAPAAR